MFTYQIQAKRPARYMAGKMTIYLFMFFYELFYKTSIAFQIYL